MKAYFLNISEDEKKSITDKHKELYNGYQVMQPKGNMSPLTVGNYALDEGGVTVNSRGDVTEYKNTGINKPMKKVCEGCGEMYENEVCECGYNKEMMEGECNECGDGNMYEGKLCECGSGMNESECSECWSEMYSEEQIEESIKLKSKKSSVIKDINESLNWFKKLI
jgi:hypothetical protein